MNGVEFMTGMSIVAAALMIACAAIGTGLGIGQIGSKFIEGAARNPENAGRLQLKAILMVGMLEAVPVISIGMGMLLLFANPLI